MTQKFYEIVWDIRPLEGVGPLEFGMSSEEVADLIGKPDHSRPFDPFFLPDEEKKNMNLLQRNLDLRE